MNHRLFKNKLMAIVAMFVMMLGVGAAIAMKVPEKKSKAKFATSWFTYNGSGNVTDPANYTQVSGNPNCPGSTNMCSVQATVGTGSKPVLTDALKAEINNAIANGTPTANVHLQD